MSTAVHSARLQTRQVDARELLPQEAILMRGFAGHTIKDYPEPARSYTLAFWRLEPIWKQLRAPTPLLVCVQGELVGVMNSIWSWRVGLVPVRRVSQNQLEVLEVKITFLTGDAIDAISFSTDEVLQELPSWCR